LVTAAFESEFAIPELEILSPDVGRSKGGSGQSCRSPGDSFPKIWCLTSFSLTFTPEKLPRIRSAARETQQEGRPRDSRSYKGLSHRKDIDARIMQVLEAESSPSVRTIAEFLKIPASTRHLHLISSLSMKIRHFK
jgi:hypothetical protein